MTSLQLLSERSATAHVSTGAHYSLYSRLLRGQVEGEQDNVRDFLHEQLEIAKKLPSNLPADLADLSAWVASNSHSVAERYRVYLDERKALRRASWSMAPGFTVR
jgi:hypothetical protein